MDKARFITSAKANKKPKIENTLVTLILLCDHPGYRMKSYGPPSLISIQNQKLIDIQISAIQNVFNNFEVILCAGYDVDKVYKYLRSKYSHIKIRIVENQNYESSNSCESVRVALNNTYNDKIIICDGSLLLTPNVLSAIDLNKSSVCMQENGSCPNLEVGININENQLVEYFSFGAVHQWSEIVFLHNNEIIDTLRKLLANGSYKQKFTFEALNELIKMKFKLSFTNNPSIIQKVNHIKTYHSIKELV